MKILFIACLRANTGNSTTADRIKSHLEAAGHKCELQDAAGLQSPLMVAKLISQRKFDAGLAIHVYKAGRFLLGSRIPFGVIFGGTDINEDVRNEEKFQLMGHVLNNARFAVAFTCKMKEVAAKHWPQAISKIHIQPQGILTTPNVSFDLEAFLRNAGMTYIPGESHIFLLICGLRRVKDPLYLVEAFAEWHEREPGICLAIIGPMVDPLFTDEVKGQLHNVDGVHLIDEIPQADLQALIKRSFAVVNSSLSEGMSAAILEAMDLEIPVLARDILGNAAIICHENTGLLFSTPKEFVKLAKRLMSEPDLKRKITNNAKNYIRSHHSWELERETYQNLVQICLAEEL
ncbi:glycosyltransferase 1 domain-containing protein 1 isoform X2 [Hyla sarda]|uniref:glycosyltransferase 1 domain-containing protein 1 isoform X2 n=1 Tax=Hyla sarda TaxID=327740 RepID=UPI0024C44FFC|nr:glycosyltransferase 1 domain-containing protein 1 isoform X2 [Hyla sarda]